METMASLISVIIVLNCWFALSVKAENFDYYKLAIEWPISHCNLGENCNKPVIEEFRIHGLWHFWANHSIVRQCDGLPMAKLTKVNKWSIKKYLDTYWPALSGDSYVFWTYQWNNHGKCSGLLPVDYFKLALSLAYQHIQLKNGLIRKGFAPNSVSGYNLTQIGETIGELSFNKKAEIKCNMRQSKYQLLEVHHCYGRDNAIRDCVDSYVHCAYTTTRKVMFPDKASVPPKTTELIS